MPADLLIVSAQASREPLPALDTAQLLYLLVQIAAPEGAVAARLPLNLCLVIDRSTSMDGERLAYVKRAAERLVDQLGDRDVLAVVAFSDRAEVICPAGRAASKVALIAGIRSLAAGGGTEIFQGLLAGVAELRKMPLDGYHNHLILLTDGQTYGDSAECLSLAAESAAAGIDFTALGIGADWNDVFLDRLVSFSGGQSVHIDAPNQVVDSLRGRVHGLEASYARNVRLTLDKSPQLELQAAFKVAPFAQPVVAAGDGLELGSLEGNAPISLLLELLVPPQGGGPAIEIPFAVTADFPALRLRQFSVEHRHAVAVGKTERPQTVQLSAEVVQAVQALTLYRLNEDVWSDLEAGRVDGATVRLQHLTQRLEEAGYDDLAVQARAETQKLLQMGTMSLEGRKRLKYGTRALLTLDLRPRQQST